MMDGLVTVIGGGGFVGRYAAQALMRTGVRFRAAQRDPRRAHFLRQLGSLGQTQFVGVDVTRPDTIRHAIEGSSAVVNLAGTFGPSMSRVQADGAAAVAKAAAAAGVSALVHVSAIGADADSPSMYGRSKGEGEQEVRAAYPRATILRPSTIFGSEDQFVNRFAGMIGKAPVVPVLAPGARFQPVYVADVAEAIRAAVTDPVRFGGRTFELGGPDILTMRELLHWIAGEVGRAPRFLELPDAVSALIASLPGTPISKDQWTMLQRDSVVSAGADGLEALGVTPTPLAAVAPQWLVRYRRMGRFARHGEIAA